MSFVLASLFIIIIIILIIINTSSSTKQPVNVIIDYSTGISIVDLNTNEIFENGDNYNEKFVTVENDPEEKYTIVTIRPIDPRKYRVKELMIIQGSELEYDLDIKIINDQEESLKLSLVIPNSYAVKSTPSSNMETQKGQDTSYQWTIRPKQTVTFSTQGPSK